MSSDTDERIRYRLYSVRSIISLLKTAIAYGYKSWDRPRKMLLHWNRVMLNGDGDRNKPNYGELKFDHLLGKYWCQWNLEPAHTQRT